MLEMGPFAEMFDGQKEDEPGSSRNEGLQHGPDRHVENLCENGEFEALPPEESVTFSVASDAGMDSEEEQGAEFGGRRKARNSTAAKEKKKP